MELVWVALVHRLQREGHHALVASVLLRVSPSGLNHQSRPLLCISTGWNCFVMAHQGRSQAACAATKGPTCAAACGASAL